MKPPNRLRSVLLSSLLAWILAAGLPADLGAQSMSEPATDSPGSGLSFQALTDGGKYVGVALFVGQRKLGEVRFSSNNLITADGLQVLFTDGSQTWRFTGVAGKAGSGVAFDPRSHIEFSVGPDAAYAGVSFLLTVNAFDKNQWQSVARAVPFHFLAMYLDTAKVFTQRGWLIPTPLEDPFPLLIDPHDKSPQIAADWSRNWSYAPPLSAFAVPMTGIWDPDGGVFMAYDFTRTRLYDHSEIDLAAAYAYQPPAAVEPAVEPAMDGGGTRQFISLVYPHQGRAYQTLTYLDAVPVTIESSFELFWSTDLDRAGDPNQLFFGRLFRRFPDLLPGSPEVADMSFVPGRLRLDDATGWDYEISWPALHAPADSWATKYVEDGTRLLITALRHRDSLVLSLLRQDRYTELDNLVADVDHLMPWVQKFQINGEDCASIPKPYHGRFRDLYGGDAATTRHNSDTFCFAQIVAEIYRLFPDWPGAPPVALGIHDQEALLQKFFSFSKYFVWTRDEVVDVPSSQFAVGFNCLAGFLINYHLAYKDDPVNSARAEEAIEIVRRLAYKYLPVWLGDTDPSDGVYPSFLFEPNSGKDWAGTACSNEISGVLEALAIAYVYTGDRYLKYVVNGGLARWPTLYHDFYTEAPPDDPLLKVGQDTTSERYGIGDGSIEGKGHRSSWGTHDKMPLFYPIRNTRVRVIAGPRGAFVTNKGGKHTNLTGYRYQGDANLSFTVTTRLPEVGISLTVPYLDLTTKEVTKNGSPASLHRPFSKPSSLEIYGLGDGDVVQIGNIDPAEPPIDISNPLPYRQIPPEGLSLENGGFIVRNLPYDATVSLDWKSRESFAGLIEGLVWSRSVPVFVNPVGTTRRNNAVSSSLTVEPSGAKALFVVYGSTTPRTAALLVGSGPQVRILSPGSSNTACVFWKIAPHLYPYRLYLDHVELDTTNQALTITPLDSVIFAVTAYHGSAAKLDAVRQAMEKGHAEVQNDFKHFEAVDRINAFLASHPVPDKSIALIPPNHHTVSQPDLEYNLTLLRIINESDLRYRVDIIGDPRVLVDPGLFSATLYPLAIYSGGESYIHTVHAPGDGKNAILDYLGEGGCLLLLDGGPYPMYRGTGLFQTDPPSVWPPLPPVFGLELGWQWSDPNPDRQSVRFSNLDGVVLPNVPSRFDYPRFGDLRVRTLSQRTQQDYHVYRDLVELTIGGHSAGTAAVEVSSPGRRGKAVYVSSRLSTHEAHGATILADVLIHYLGQRFPLSYASPGQTPASENIVDP